MKLFYYLAIALPICASCTNGSSKEKGKATTEQVQDTLKRFTLPEIPTMYTTPEQRADFLVKHYWDHFDFTDTTYINLPDVAEQAYVDFLDVSQHVPMPSAYDGMKRLVEYAEKNKKVFDYFISLSDKYLYDPNSPFRNEDLYIAVLERMIETNLLDDTEKTRPQYRLELAQKNRVGTKALNFTYTMSSGKQNTLYGTQAEYTLLYINNPGCHACAEITEQMKASQIIQGLLSQKRIAILCIYPDEELDEWKKHQDDFQSTWINGYDKNTIIRNKSLYDLRATPSLYLMDKNKTVLLKDATLLQIEQFLSV